jgi:hypothetical protein
VRIELHHPGAIDVLPHVPEARFPVMATRPVPATTPSGAPAGETQVSHAAWLQDLPEGGVRRIFEHLTTHGAVTEAEAAAMLGGARALRRFALDFDALVRRAPFGVRIDVVAGVKHYVKEGANR